jgi:hypothetical protein
MTTTFSDVLSSIKKNLVSVSTVSAYSELQQRVKLSINQNMEIMDNLIDIAVKYEEEIKRLEAKNEKLEELVLTKVISVLK